MFIPSCSGDHDNVVGGTIGEPGTDRILGTSSISKSCGPDVLPDARKDE